MYRKYWIAGLIPELCRLHSITIHLKIKKYLSSSSRPNLSQRQLIRPEDGSILLWQNRHCFSTKHHMRMLSYLDMYRMRMDRRCPSPREMRWIRLMHCRHTAQTLSAGISIRHPHHGFQRDSPASLCLRASVSLWERSGIPMRSSYFMQILTSLTLQNTSWSMTNYRLWISGCFLSSILQ
ncbi:unknown [Roseburia sp. CAG:18]|nr:unknown [Roseburia sp. CAG:18]